jgi:CHAD domain-containing protein
MPYRFKKRETVSEGCRRILFEQTASIISALSDRGSGGLDDRIHDTRRRIKRVRALLHLLDLRVDEKALAAHEEALRSTARKLAPARDATVVLAAFEEIAVEFTGGAVERIRELLTEAVRHAKRKSLGPEKLVVLAGDLRTTCEALSRAGTAQEGWSAIGPGIYKSYQQAKKLKRLAFAAPTPENVHACRARSKRLWEQLRLLRRTLPKSIARLLPRLDKFTELLGRHHDFHMLQMTLREAAAHGLEVAKFPRLHQSIGKKMDRCLNRAGKQGAKIFELHPKAFASRVHAGWKDWCGNK